jgi:hypothetical protein
MKQVPPRAALLCFQPNETRMTAARRKTPADAKRAVEDQPTDVAGFDYSCAAELFPTRSLKSRGGGMGYRRFARAAEAIRFAVEELPAAYLPGTYLEVDEKRFSGAGIRALYDSTRYPLKRR